MLRHLVFGSFIAAVRARRGRGLPKSQQAWDDEYRDGSWNFLDGLSERSHHMVVLGFVLGMGEDRRVLDVGCGTGGLLDLGRKFQLSGYTGIDISTTAIENARQRFRDTNIRFPVTFEAANFESYVSPKRYDAIIFNESLSYASDPVAILDRFRGFLAPGGMFLVSLCYNWWQEPIMRRLTAAFPTLYSTDVINEEGLTWQVRVLSGNSSGLADATNSVSKGSRRLGTLRSEIAERSLMTGENFGAVFNGLRAILVGRNAR